MHRILSNSSRLLHFDNIIHLPGQPGDVLSLDPSLTEGVIIMSTYEEFMVLLTAGILLVAILDYVNHKK
jgi:hypothetical protein